ncbi:MAG TPA: nucleoside recognition domain-containing protein [Thermodesulfobacteriota bacterium]|nr:nucleoside recognition domain-containing protein [Thermodesulfobacteriota bacterium]
MNTINAISQAIIPLFILFAVLYGVISKIRVFDCFISGAKDGAGVVIRIFPYVLAIFIAVSAFQASGALDFLKAGVAPVFSFFNFPLEVIPLAIVKPLSGTSAIAVFTDIVKTTGPDSIASLTSAVIIGSAETTFYVLAVYLGAVGIKRTRYLVPVCVISDLVGIAIAIAIVKLLF